MSGEVYTMNDVRGFLGIHHSRQWAIIDEHNAKAGTTKIVINEKPGEKGKPVQYYTGPNYRRFLRAAGYRHVMLDGKIKLVHEKYIKDNPGIEVQP